MGIRFIHAADIHLGYAQYSCVERCFDFARAFQWVTDQAIAQRVDFVVLAGDLFNKNTIDPRTLLQATRQLQRLRDANIPVLAVQGNHEQPHYREGYSWLDYLAHTHLLVVFSSPYSNDGPRLVPWDARSCKGSYMDLSCGVRIVGAPYAGTSTSRIVEDLPLAMASIPGPRPDYTLLMLHAGLEGMLPGYSGGLTRAQLNPLRPHVDYLALGHIHKPYEQDDWVYNPGSLETNSTAEAAWKDRGYYLVELDSTQPCKHRALRVVSPRRPFRLISVCVDPYITPEALYQAIESRVASEPVPSDELQLPVVEMRLHGVLSFARGDLDADRVEAIVTQALHPLVYQQVDESTAPGELPPLEDGLSPAELERRVLGELAERDLRYRGQGERWADLLVQIKQMALERNAPEQIVGELRRFQATLGAEEPPC